MTAELTRGQRRRRRRPTRWSTTISAALDARRHRARPGHAAPGSTTTVTVVPVSVVKGLELDGVVVVEPARIVARRDRRACAALYVALTRPTQRLTVVHAEDLPACDGVKGPAPDKEQKPSDGLERWMS